LFDHAPLRLDLAAIEIHPLDGVVQLRGHVSNDLLRRMAEDQVQGITGMSELHNDLVADNDLAATVSMALALDSRTAGQHIGVYPRLGEIHLRGSVRTRAAYEGASNVAGAVPAVTRIMNELRIDPDANEISVLAGVTNREDMVPGGR
jgi:osmotically-inducible protein OsmY